jgi:CCR4-NOT transcriptional complex subunit CAF120
MSQFSATYGKDSSNPDTPPTPTSSPPADDVQGHYRQNPVPNGDTTFQTATDPYPQPAKRAAFPAESAPSSPARAEYPQSPTAAEGSPSASPTGRARSSSRPQSMIQTYQPTPMDVNEDTIPELQPIFTFLNSHQNKLYQEGYFLKLDDQDSRKSHLSRLSDEGAAPC